MVSQREVGCAERSQVSELLSSIFVRTVPPSGSWENKSKKKSQYKKKNKNKNINTHLKHWMECESKVIYINGQLQRDVAA